MTMRRKASPPPYFDEELMALAEAWIKADTDLSFGEYLMRHASVRVKTYLRETEDVNDEDE